MTPTDFVRVSLGIDLEDQLELEGSGGRRSKADSRNDRADGAGSTPCLVSNNERDRE